MGDRTDRLQRGTESILGGSSRPPPSATSPPPSGGRLTIRAVEDAVSRALKSTPKYSSAQPEAYNFVRDGFADQYDGITKSDLTFRINTLANYWKSIHNGVWPSSSDMLNWETAQNSIYAYASGFSQLEYRFGITEDDGSTNYWINDPIRGVIPDTNPTTIPGGGHFQTSRPTYASADLPSILSGLSPVSVSRGGGGGGGGAGRTPATFDRAQLAEEGTNRWRGLLLEEPTDEEINSFVSDYIVEANAFWMKDAGRLDYDTFVTNRIRGQERHKFLYGKKPEFQTEAEYMGGFRQTASQFGLSRRTELAEVESGASQGVGLSGFGERVGRTREARVINQGTYSQRFAANMAQSGLGRT